MIAKTELGALVQCEECDLVVFLPLPQDSEIPKIYAGPEYFSGEKPFSKDHLGAMSTQGIQASFRVVREIKKLCPPPARMLDIGCATGSMLKAAELLGYEVTGIEISPYASSLAREQLNLNVYNCRFEDAPLNKEAFDLALCFHVLEHVLSPCEFLARCWWTLRPGGLLVLEVPDFGSLPAQALRTRWPHFKPMEHIHYFTRQSLEALLQKSGLKIVAVQRDGLLSLFQMCPLWHTPSNGIAHDNTTRDVPPAVHKLRGLLRPLPGVVHALERFVYSVVPVNDFLRVYAVKGDRTVQSGLLPKQ